MSMTHYMAANSNRVRQTWVHNGWRAALALWLGSTATACAGNEHSVSPTTAETSGTSAGGMGGRRAGTSAAGVGGTGGRSGSGGVSGDGGDSGSAGDTYPTITCGSKQCSTPPAGLSQLAGGLPIPGIPIPVACCVDSAAGTQCGTAPSPTGTCEVRAVADSRCTGVDPGALAAFSGGTVAGCCTSNGACGVDGALFGRGCIENGEAATQLATIPLLGTTITIPAPRACDPDAGVSEDGGS
jgi:hypothetical protein